MKTIIVLYGNCQLGIMSRLLNQHYSDIFNVIQITNFDIIRNKISIPTIFTKAEILIYQPLKGYGNYDSEWIIKNMVPKKCKLISMSYLYFSGYFPDYHKSDLNSKTISAKYPYGLFPYCQKKISQQIEKNINIGEIIENSKLDSWISNQEIIDNCESTLKYLENQEISLDISTVDFIRNNFKKYKLFHTVNHPSNILLQFVIDQICKKLDLPKIILDEIEYLGGFTSIIYPCVTKSLGLEFNIKSWTYDGNKYISYEDWIIDYNYILFSQ